MSERIRVLIGQPFDHGIEPESYTASLRGTLRKEQVHAQVLRPNQSCLLARSFNDCVVACLNGGYDYFGLLHADVSAPDGWADVLLEEMGTFDAIHAVVAIKNHCGLTSTAVAYSDDEWEPVRKITTAELEKLPTTFDIDTLRECYDADAYRLLPNTGCLLVRAEVLQSFPGFSVLDRVRKVDGKWIPETVPEDWHFGHWAARNGFRVGGTRKVVTEHYGRAPYPSNRVWGAPVDGYWSKNRKSLVPAG